MKIGMRCAGAEVIISQVRRERLRSRHRPFHGLPGKSPLPEKDARRSEEGRDIFRVEGYFSGTTQPRLPQRRPKNILAEK